MPRPWLSRIAATSTTDGSICMSSHARTTRSCSWRTQVVNKASQQTLSLSLSATMDDPSGEKHKQERALRAVQVAAVSGFLESNQRLQESCLSACNSCRESVPFPRLRVDRDVPSTLVTVFWPDRCCTKADGVSRVLPPRRVLELDWKFEDPMIPTTLKDIEWVVEPTLDTEEDEEEGKDEAKEQGKPENESRYEQEGAEEGGQEIEEEEEEEGNEKEEEEWEAFEYLPEALWDMDMSKVRWPEGVKELYLWGFNRPICGVVWPVGLEVLSFQKPPAILSQFILTYGAAGIFNEPLGGVSFPPGLREIFLGHEFDQPIDVVAWPEGLERLSMPCFNKPIHDVQWPSGLKILEFMTPHLLDGRKPLEKTSLNIRDGCFDQPLGSFLPASLEVLWLSNFFTEPLRDVVWPSGLTVLGVGTQIYGHSFHGIRWPPRLRVLVLSDFVEGMVFTPQDCKVIYTNMQDVSDSNQDALDMYNSSFSDDVNYDSFGSDFSL